MRRYLPLAILLVLGILAGVVVRACASGSGDDGAAGAAPAAAPSAAVSFADCRALTTPPAEAAGGGGTAGAGGGLPDIVLPCFGGEELRLADVRGPAVINLWGTWCEPCREELPAIKAVAQQTEGLVHFLGVDTRDDQSHGQDMVTEFGLPYPNVYDRGERVRIALQQPGIPVTLFVDRSGSVAHLYNGARLDEASLKALVTEHLGVAVPVG